ncbi:GumC family protein [Arcticibacter eurypsychrophilus]|uniref:GumC family protein n=1 Tax=Arcticibacter eurypsychrophilus TaxID=1434752 RepID=UPI00084DC91C|nr:polysaccharide biosynthesis tyrosine autokinase [Arcticibacter eurypsychrophilus]
MKYKQLPYTSFGDNKEENPNKVVRELLNKYLYHWPLFLLSILICVSAAVFYIKNDIPVYNIQAKLSIKDDQKSSSTAKAALQELDILKSPKIIENEVAIIKSRPLMEQVVNQLHLWVNYKTRINYSYKDLYAESPVQFELLTDEKRIKSRTFEITVKNASNFILKNEDGSSQSFAFNTPLKNKLGTWVLKSTEKINEYVGKNIQINVERPEKVVTDYQQLITVTLDKSAPIVGLQVSDEVPERGLAILNALIGAYQVSNVKDKNKETQSTLKFIDNRLASLTGELTNVEKDVENYKSSIGLTDISSQSQLYLDNVQSNESKLNEVNIQLNVINGIERYVNSSNSSTAPATLGIADPGLVSLVEQLTRLQLQRNRLLATTPEENPIFAPINSQIHSIKDAIKSKVDGIKSSYITTRKQLQSFNSGIESSIKHIPGQERQYVSIKRQQGIKENLYVYLLQKREEVALSYASTLTDARTVEEPYFDEPKSNKKYPIALALLGGLLLPMGLIAGRNTIKNVVLTKNELEMATGVPVICELSHSESKAPIVVLNRASYAIGEQMRALRTNLLQVNNRKGKAKVTLFTSSIAGEGKSFVTSNIGASLAASGKKTIILELDLRKPKITKIFNLDNEQPGLSDLLNGEATKEEVIQPSGVHPNLFVMKSGPIPFNPSELLESTEMEVLINELRFEFDNILIDSPPLRLVTDALVLAPLCDICLYMVRHNYTSKSELGFIQEVYQAKKLPNMHLVFNGVHMDQRYGYAVDYGYLADSAKPSIISSLFKNFGTRF